MRTKSLLVTQNSAGDERKKAVELHLDSIGREEAETIAEMYIGRNDLMNAKNGISEDIDEIEEEISQQNNSSNMDMINVDDIISSMIDEAKLKATSDIKDTSK